MDSIHLAETVAKHLQFRKNLSSLRVLDLCAGCGVVGIELSWYLRQLKQIDFIEVQEIYTPYFYHNVAIVNRPELSMQWHLMNYEELLHESWAQRYDLIISNPPYFQPHHGMLSPSKFKNRCRFYLDSTFENYILSLKNVLAPNGEAYFLLRNLQQHGIELLKKMEILLKDSSISIIPFTNIRSTEVILLKSKSAS